MNLKTFKNIWRVLSEHFFDQIFGEVIFNEDRSVSCDFTREGTQALNSQFALISYALNACPNGLRRKYVKGILRMSGEYDLDILPQRDVEEIFNHLFGGEWVQSVLNLLDQD